MRCGSTTPKSAVIENVPKGLHSVSVYGKKGLLYGDGEVVVNQGEIRVEHNIKLGESRPTALGNPGKKEGSLPKKTNPAYEPVSNQFNYGLSLQETSRTIPPADRSRHGGNPYVVTVELIIPERLPAPVDRVTYYLHPTFSPSVVTRFPQDNFVLQFYAWGSFKLHAAVYLTNGEVINVSTQVLDGY